MNSFHLHVDISPHSFHRYINAILSSGLFLTVTFAVYSAVTHFPIA